jgi:glutamate dehydrogenase (NADP+)
VSKIATDRTGIYLRRFINGVKKRNPGEREFHQAVSEVAETIFPYIADKPIYHKMQIMERMAEPDRVVMFRVPWTDDKGNIRNQRGYRVQFNNSIGPYKGGLRFHPSVNLSVLKFLGFEQTFKNSLTGLPMGGAKGGSDFNPKGKTDNEVMRFCQSFMIELHRHIGEDTDIPAGDIGVGAREIGYLFGQYKRIENRFVGVLTGKGMAFGGSKIRTEATGYGAVYFMQNMLAYRGDDIRGKSVCVSGSGNVASYAVEKVNHLGGKVVTLSDSSGFIHDPDGINAEKLDYVLELKNVRRGRIGEYAEVYKGASFHEGRPWSVPCDIALPCATQNEINREDAQTLVDNGCMGVSEGANMPTDLDGINVFQQADILYAPSKAANAGGVAVSGLEMSQNSSRISWDEAELDKLLKGTMQKIHDSCVEYGKKGDRVDYLAGANIAGFIKVADAMLSFGHT